MKKTLLALVAATAFIVLLAMMPSSEVKPSHYHTPEQLALLHERMQTPLDSGEYFHTPSNCKGCHGFDTLGLANVDVNGVDVNLYDDWETSMMGLSGVDPLWRAKVSHEIQVNPGHANELQTFCTSCHAPMGHYTALYKHQQFYTLADLENDSLGRAGVACSSCHAIGTDGLGNLFSGQIPYDTNRFIYGPFDNPMQGPMQLYVGLTPVKSDHVSESRMCSPCHTLISGVVDLSGVPTGASFVEQATHHEWVNSAYPSQLTVCQSCHMPQIEDPIKIANGYTALPGRSPFNLHQFAGANSFMVNLIKNNKAALGVSAEDANFDSTLSAINTMLTKNSVQIETSTEAIANDTAFFNVSLTNKAGHKFPSGYPSRRAVLQFIVTKANGDTLFASGLFDANKEVINIDPIYETHYDQITDQSQVQIYEMVMGDVNGDKTTVLERSAIKLKDNRIPPLGFTTQHNNYDTCYIAGSALIDPDFNKTGAVEGSGKDIVHYHVALNGYSGLMNISATMYYQAVPPAWLTEMFTFTSPQIDTFQQMFNVADQTPVLMLADTLLNVSTDIKSMSWHPLLTFTPNPTATGKVLIAGADLLLVEEVKVYNSSGHLVSLLTDPAQKKSLQIDLPKQSGVYFIRVKTVKGNFTEKILRL